MVTITRKQAKKIEFVKEVLSIYGLTIDDLINAASINQIKALDEKIDALKEDVMTIRKYNDERAKEEERMAQETQKWLFEQEMIK